MRQFEKEECILKELFNESKLLLNDVNIYERTVSNELDIEVVLLFDDYNNAPKIQLMPAHLYLDRHSTRVRRMVEYIFGIVPFNEKPNRTHHENKIIIHTNREVLKSLNGLSSKTHDELDKLTEEVILSNNKSMDLITFV